MPVHAGHLALIDFAAQQCDELIVSLSYTQHDPIPANLRIAWMKEIFEGQPLVKLKFIPDDFDQPNLPLEDRTRLWADVLMRIYPPIDLVISSEPYGEYLAKHLKATALSFDPTRARFPVSASLIRSNPFKFWEFIPAVVRPYFVKIICFYGPESTGKSTLAKRLADHYQTEFVPEVARELISSNAFTLDEIIEIGKAQTERVKEKLMTANKILFCDTDLITTQIYSRHYLNVVPPILFELEKEIHYDQYFLFDIDVPWVGDGLRDLGDKRQQMLSIFKSELDERGVSYQWVNGTFEDRLANIKSTIDLMLND
jgi:HTH-type transcriptional repressor of NAD biosynthesis genes